VRSRATIATYTHRSNATELSEFISCTHGQAGREARENLSSGMTEMNMRQGTCPGA